MTATRGLRLAVVGATGALGTEVLVRLDAARLRIGQLVAVAGEDSLGTDVEFQDEVVPVHAELPALHGLDGVFCCAPGEAAAEVVRAALRAEVPCLDASGGFAGQAEVPLVWDPSEVDREAPLLAMPPPAAGVWHTLLRELEETLGPVERLDVTILEAASALGRRGIEALSAESLALFNQQELPEESGAAVPLAFDCAPDSGEPGDGGRSREVAMAAALARGLGRPLSLSARWVRVPAFVGQAHSGVLHCGRAVDPRQAAEAVAKAPGLELWDREGEGPNLRAAAGRDSVLVAAPEADPGDAKVLRLWAAADPLRWTAARAVAAMAARLGPA